MTAPSSDLSGSAPSVPTTPTAVPVAHTPAGSEGLAPAHPSVPARVYPGRVDSLDVTVVLPCYNEEAHVLQELERITAAMEASEFSYELLVIDDKSTDSTLQVL